MNLVALKHRLRDVIIIHACGILLGFFLLFGVMWQAWPELGDDAKPVVRIEGLQDRGRYSSLLAVTFSVQDDMTKVAQIQVKLDGKPVYDKAIGERYYYDGTAIEITKLAEGEHQFVISITDSSLWRRQTVQTITFTVDRTVPRVAASSFKADVSQGDTAGFFVKSDEALHSLTLEALGKKTVCYELGGTENGYRGLLPVNLFTVPGVYEARFTAKDLAGNQTILTHMFTIKYRSFLRETIEVPKEKSGILYDSKRIQKDYDAMNAALKQRAPTQFWRNTFLRPAEGIESSPFGIMRVYSTRGIASYHRGIDIANKEGTPVLAANNGIVLLAQELFLYGNTVILDHGQGVVTFYCHLSRLDVGQGDLVARGELLGAIGTTGLSTGPHLHWEMQVEGAEVNPLEWESESFETIPVLE